MTVMMQRLWLHKDSVHVHEMWPRLVNIVVNIYNVTNVKINLFDYEHLVCKSFISIKCGLLRLSIKNENVVL